GFGRIFGFLVGRGRCLDELSFILSFFLFFAGFRRRLYGFPLSMYVECRAERYRVTMRSDLRSSQLIVSLVSSVQSGQAHVDRPLLIPRKGVGDPKELPAKQAAREAGIEHIRRL